MQTLIDSYTIQRIIEQVENLTREMGEVQTHIEWLRAAFDTVVKLLIGILSGVTLSVINQIIIIRLAWGEKRRKH